MNIKLIKRHLIAVFATAILLAIIAFMMFVTHLERVEHENYCKDAQLFLDKVELYIMKNGSIGKTSIVNHLESYESWQDRKYYLIINKENKLLFSTLKPKNTSQDDLNENFYFKKRKVNNYEIFILISKDEIYGKMFYDNKNIILYLFLLLFAYMLLFIYLSRSLERFLGTSQTTGLENSDKLLELVAKTRNNFMLLTIDVKNFSNINHAYGLEIGDRLLVEIGNVLTKLIEKSMTLFHVGGDRFIIYKKGHTSLDIKSLVDKIRSFTKHNSFYIDDLKIKIEFDYAVLENEHKEPIKKSYIALAEAKKKKEHIIYYSRLDKKEDEYLKSLKSSQKLLTAVKKELFEPVFQPIFNNRTGKIEKFEALVRLIDEETGSYLTPNLFLEQVKEIGKIKDLTRIMIDKVFKEMQNRELTVSINLTEEDFLDKTFITFLKKKFKEYNINPKNIIFEIVESITRSDSVVKIVKELKELGCLIAIDDFGTEHSNFLRLLELQVDFIKIDGAFIKTINDSYKSFKIVETIVNFANSINTSVVAEFVATDKIQKKVLELKIEYSQGYLISKPQKGLDIKTSYLFLG